MRKIGVVAGLLVAVAVLAACVFTTCEPAGTEGPTEPQAAEPAAGTISDTGSVVDFREEQDVAAGAEFSEWMHRQGWASVVGNPVYFYVRDGALNMVSDEGPVFRKQTWYAIFDREKLRKGIENQILLRFTAAGFRVSLDDYPTLAFRMEPVALPGKEADMRDAKRNDTAFCLLVSFDAERHDYQGTEFPESVGYVWANRKWDEPTGSDPDYEKFIRYIPVGYGPEGLGQEHEFRRDVKADWRLAYPEHAGEPVPDVIRIGFMMDSNNAKTRAHARLTWVRFEKGAAATAQQPAP
jgi:hypothetical protein